MTNRNLLAATALQTCALVFLASAAPAMAQPQSQSPASDVCDANSPGYDPNTKNCTQQPEGRPGTTAPGTNPATAPSDEQPTVANTAPSRAGSEQNTIVITGSRIPRPQFEGTIPGAQVTGQQIAVRSFNSAAEALRDQPLVSRFGPSNLGTNGGQPGSLGVTFVDLLALGSPRTLTLVNSRRFVTGNEGTLFVAGNLTGSQVDLSVIPAALIARTDILTVGGATAYGSDAIAGVVNIILKDDYHGIQLSAQGGISDRNDVGNYRFSGIAGTNFAGDRGNVAVSFEHTHDDALMGNQRPEYLADPLTLTYYLNGTTRNGAYSPTFPATTTCTSITTCNTPFIASGFDGIPTTFLGLFPAGSFLTSRGGSVTAVPSTTNLQTQGNCLLPYATPAAQGPLTCQPGPLFANGVPNPRITTSTTAQLITGAPLSATIAGCSTANLTTFCNFAPSGLPGTAGTAARDTFSTAVINTYAPSLAATAAGGTAAQRDALALQLLQKNKPTLRDYFAANPGTDPNKFFAILTETLASQTGAASTAPLFLTVANTGADAALFPRIAVPLQFNDAGDIVTGTTCITPTTPGTTNVAPCASNFLDPSTVTVLRAGQTRDIGNIFGHYKITDAITAYIEGLGAHTTAIAPNNTVASLNSIGTTSTENGALLMSINNPFLDAGDRAALLAAGVPAGGNFLLSRTNQDLAPGGQNPYINKTNTYRGVFGLKGAFGLFGNSQRWDISAGYGQNKAHLHRSVTVKDMEYALALDAVTNSSGQIVCRSQLNPSAYIGKELPGIQSTDIIRTRNSDGSYTESLVVRTITAEMVANCQPLNPFGYGQMSEAARAYVTHPQDFFNTNKQTFFQGSLAGNLFNLPGGPFGYAFSAEHRTDSINFTTDQDYTALGHGRSAYIATSLGSVNNTELGAEVRIPIFGDNFNIPLFRSLDFTPGIRFVKQTGSAPKLFAYNAVNPSQPIVNENKYGGGWDKVWSIAGNWRPIRDLTIRANLTRSLRQPSVTELFLLGQPAFNAYTDPCANITSSSPAARTANCRQAVIDLGLATDQATAATFLSTYSGTTASLTGFFSGNTSLQPERGKGFTVGASLRPRFIPGLQLGADYFIVRMINQIVPINLTTATQLCMDSPTYNDSSAIASGTNTCLGYQRDPATFTVANGFRLNFLNLGALRVRALNLTASYNTSLDSFIHGSKLELFANAVNMWNNGGSFNNDLSDPNAKYELAGTQGIPKWQVQSHAAVEFANGIYGQVTNNWFAKTKYSDPSGVQPATQENYLVYKIAPWSLTDVSLGMKFGPGRRFNLQGTAFNIFDKAFLNPSSAIAISSALALGGSSGLTNEGGFGRRYRLTLTANF